MTEKNLRINWETAREFIHLGYEYNEQNEPTQWDFISQITNEDLLELRAYCSLQKYTKLPIKDYNSAWNTVNQLIDLEHNYRNVKS